MNTTTQAPANGIFNGIYLRTREYDVDVHNLDTAHLMRMNAGHTNMYEKSTDLGMVRPWITTGYMERDGLFDMINTSQGVKRVTLDGHIARFQYPIGQQPTKILEDISGTDTAGIDGTTFKMKFNKPFGNGAILSPDKFLQLEVIVTPDQITGNDASGYVHTVRLNSTNAKFKFLDKSYLQQGTVWFRTGSVGAEYSRTYDSLNKIKAGHREYYLHVGEGFAHKHFEVTRDAAFSKAEGPIIKSLQEYRQMLEIYEFAKGSPLAEAVMRNETPVDFYVKKGLSPKDALERVKSELVGKAVIPVVEAIAMKEVQRDVDFYSVWGSGGTVLIDGKQEVNLPVGLFHQFNLGSFVPYNIPTFTLERLEAILSSRLKDKMDPYGRQIITIGSGRGGLKIAREQIRKRFLGNNYTTMSKDYISGDDNQQLFLDTQNFMSYRWEFGIIRFTHIPALDPITANEISNPMYMGHRLSSYMYIIDDLSGEGGNVEELVYGADWDFNHFYENGRLDYETMGHGKRPFHGNHNIPGFKVFVEKRHKAYRLIDPTKSLIIKPINPNTGKMIFEPTY
jgi:hypothetical protein